MTYTVNFDPIIDHYERSHKKRYASFLISVFGLLVAVACVDAIPVLHYYRTSLFLVIAAVSSLIIFMFLRLQYKEGSAQSTEEANGLRAFATLNGFTYNEGNPLQAVNDESLIPPTMDSDTITYAGAYWYIAGESNGHSFLLYALTVQVWGRRSIGWRTVMRVANPSAQESVEKDVSFAHNDEYVYYSVPFRVMKKAEMMELFRAAHLL